MKVAVPAPWLDKHAVAKRLGISAALALDLARRRKLVSYRIGKYVRFKPADVDQFEASCRRTPDPVEPEDPGPITPLPQPRRRRFS